MKKLLLLFTACSLLAMPMMAQDNIDPVSGEDYSLSCTALLIGKDASTDGSTMTSHSCDGNYRTWSNIVPRKTFEEGEEDIIQWGLLKTEEPHDFRNVTTKGSIPAPNKETYAYLNTAYPCLNEKQLAIGETTFVGRKELRNEEGLFLIEELQRIVLQRTSTAREAIKLIGELVAEYGYGDSGECLTFADKEEIWIFEITGSGTKGKGKPTALWVAQRIPDDHVGVSANVPRIAEVDFNNPDYFMYSEDLRERSKDLGYWNGKDTYKFYKVAGDKKNFAIRDYMILSSLAPSLNLSMDDEELPVSVKPEKKLSAQDAMAIYRMDYQGTEWDMSKNLLVEIDGEKVVSPIANNWMSKDFRELINTISPDAIAFTRTVSVCWCSYSEVIQCRSWLPDEIGAVAYLSYDNPGQSPRIPIYSGALSLPSEFEMCGQKRHSDDSALWRFRETNRLAQVAWGKSRESMEAEVARLEAKIFTEQPLIEGYAAELIKNGETEKAQQYITDYTADFAGAAFYSWERLGEKYWLMFGRGF